MIDLEEENSIDRNRLFCENYNKKDATSLLIQEHEDSAGIVYSYHKEVLCSFIRFIVVDNVLVIRSLQIRRKYEYTLRGLISDTYDRILPLKFDLVQGEAYKHNSLAIKFHTKLGLVYTQDLNDSLRFLVEKSFFMSAIQRYIK
jgi:hypothetical protein